MNLPSEMNPAQLPHMLRDSAARSGQDFTVSPLEFRELEATSAWGSQPGSRAQAARFDMAAQAEKIRILAERVNIEIRLGRERLEQQKSEARSAQDAKQAEYMQRIAQERATIAGLVYEFQQDRDAYFRRAEQEVVGLALAIAARVLHREAKIDPLLLTGTVRVALEKVEDAEMWREVLARGNAWPVQPEVVADARLKSGECLLNTELGTVELGVQAQLEEIEKGFFDLIRQRPESNIG